MSMHPEPDTATLAGGCFWCLEAVFQRVEGVLEVTSGYMGGHLLQPDYDRVCQGDSGHAEVVRVSFDPARLGYGQILDIFFAIHDPTTTDRQGNDVGSQYRSAIFWHSPAQEAVARETIARLEAGQVFRDPIVTQVIPASPFWPAEAYHRDYFDRHPGQPYCRFVVEPKVAKFRQKFAALMKPGA